jgi:hypothetical protein
MKEKDDLRKCVRQRDRLHTNQRWYTEQGAFTSRGYASLRTYEWIEVEENDLLK